MSTIEEPATETRRWVGQSVPRKEDPKLLTGRAGFIGDVVLPGMLHGAVLRSPHAHARILSIDTSRGRGAARRRRGADRARRPPSTSTRCRRSAPSRCEQRAIAVERVRYPGEAVAAVAATDRYIAEDACALIRVEYEVLPARRRPGRGDGPGGDAGARDPRLNVVFHRSLDWGEVDADLARAHTIVRSSARWHRMGAHPIETAGAVASLGPVRPVDDGVLQQQLHQLPAVGVRRDPAGVDEPAAHDPVHGGRQLRQQAPDHQGHLDHRGAQQGLRPSRAVPRGPRRQRRGQRQRRLRPASTTPSSRWPRTARCSAWSCGSSTTTAPTSSSPTASTATRWPSPSAPTGSAACATTSRAC